MKSKALKIVVALSGGVDSSVAAVLLKRKGYEVCGVYMKNWDFTDETGFCAGQRDAEDAEWICHKLGIKFQQVNFVKEYWNDVFSAMLCDYTAGLTPNPDILCNKNIKFNSLFNHAINKLGAEAVATGHYAQTSFGEFLQYYQPNTDVHLLEATDPVKDQTFFLSQVSQESLRRTMFPVGGLLKPQVRAIAEEAGFTRITKRRESMGICFIGLRNFSQFISQYVDSREGDFVDIETGSILGRHNGIHHWTLGQRCKIPGGRNPYFIARKTAGDQNILVARGTDHPSLYSNMFFTEKPHWISQSLLDLDNNNVIDCTFRFQNTHKLTPCTISLTDGLIVRLDYYLRAITPGQVSCVPSLLASWLTRPAQFAVFYRHGVCLGSARIVHIGPSLYELGLIVDSYSALNDDKMKVQSSA